MTRPAFTNNLFCKPFKLNKETLSVRFTLPTVQAMVELYEQVSVKNVMILLTVESQPFFSPLYQQLTARE
jgi:hypothetical protein